MHLSKQASRLLVALGIASIGLTLLLGSVVAWAHAHSTESQNWVDLSYRTRLRLATTLRLIVDAETSARGFSLTRDEAFLQPLEQAEQTWPTVLSDLESFVAGHPAQAARAADLRAAVGERLSLARQTVDAARANPTALPEMLLNGNRRTDGIRERVAELEREERQILADRLTERTRAGTWTAVAAGGLLVLQAALWVTLAVVVRRWVSAAQLARICAWSKTVEYAGEWVTFEEYLRRRFGVSATHGISPAEAEKLARQISDILPKERS